MADRSELTDALGRFTPDRGSFDRDAIVFAAGQLAARWRGWRYVAFGLIATQAVTVLLLVPTAPPRAAIDEIVPALAPMESLPEQPSPAPSDSWIAVVRSLRDGDEAFPARFIQTELTLVDAPLTPRSGQRFD